MSTNEDFTNCEHENAFFNGVCYECPECDYQWGEIETDDEFDEDENDEEN